MSLFEPEPEQQQIHDHLMSSKLAMLFVGMGIGKTSSCLWALDSLFSDGQIRGVLVVGTLRITNLVWPAEVEKWDQFSWLKVANLRTVAGQKAFLKGSAHIYTINYESLPSVVHLLRKRMDNPPYDVEIWDESTKAKNQSSKRINRMRKHAPRAPRRWALTGTPMPNSKLDLFAQVRLIDDGKRLGEFFTHYKEAHFEQTDYMGYKWELKQGAAATIEERISDITLTIEGNRWPVHIEDVDVPLTPELMKLYKKFEKELVLELKGKDITAANAAALVSKLLQFTAGELYDSDRNVHTSHDLKTNVLKKLAEKHNPLLVSVIFQHEQARIRKMFPQAKFFADAKSASAQVEMMADWNAGKIPMLVAHPASIGHGLNMQHGGSTLVFTSGTYSRELYEQMIARLARRGQKDTVLVYRLLCPDTVDYAVVSALEAKAEGEKILLTTLKMLEAQRI